MRARLAPLACAAALLACAPTRPAPPAAARSSPGRAYPNPRVETHDGRTVRLYDDLLRDRTVVLTFGYTRCTGSCPPTTATLLRAAALLGERMGRDVHFVTLSLDPEHDSPSVLRAHAERLGAPAGWTFVTGRPDELDRVRRFFGLTDPDPAIDADRTQHAGLVLVGDVARDRWSSAPGAMRPESVAALILRTAGRAAGPPQAAAAACSSP